MGKSDYKVTFYDGESLIINAWNSIEAKILAQAERINEGKSYKVEVVELL